MSDRHPAVFLDRDGTVIHDAHFLADPAGVRLLPGAAEAVARLNRAGVPVILVTNQSGIGRGYFSEADFRAVQARVEALLAAKGGRFDAVYHCPHAPDRQPPCDCRKPGVGLFLRAAEEHRVNPGRSWYVGDRLRDLEPGERLGGRGILVRNPDHPDEEARAPAGTLVVDTLAEAVRVVLGGEEAN
ncbi:MAG TPA: HAD family hydrolase [Longimicrobiaceae bacterium]|nr:HAD family hydrolase [Longimicrobiaceae bacterium]